MMSASLEMSCLKVKPFCWKGCSKLCDLSCQSSKEVTHQSSHDSFQVIKLNMTLKFCLSSQEEETLPLKFSHQ